NSQIKNATNYDDMYELLAASDILITDYSSSMFEFSFRNKPVILYAPDIKSYTQERNFYFDFKELPYPVVENNDQLFNTIEKFDLDIYLEILQEFLSKVEIKEEGNAAYQVVQRIKEVIIK
ncbi:CDP-glycerol glycerophosphotransferase family protein, partial [Clostridium sp.]|uniref:CDP-glycerol glycerophosphotransferase family protein n=1 Tax=Clostridium sp. TaxID=1506 RepID=UPI0026038FDE